MASPQWTDDELMRQILRRYQYLNFVRRIMRPELFPAITNDPRLPAGYSATHQMSADIVENGPMAGRWIAYPQIIWDPQTRALKWFQNPGEAMQYAIQSGEYIPFQSKDAALQFSEKYKRGSAGMQEKR